MIDVVIPTVGFSVTSVLLTETNVNSFIILHSGGSLTFFKEKNSMNFSAEKGKMRLCLSMCLVFQNLGKD